MPDNLTVLCALGSYARATKRFWLSNGQLGVEAYSMSKFFDVSSIEVDSLQSLDSQLQKLNGDQTRFVIRGQLRDGIQPTNVRRKCKGATAAFEPTARQWLCIDIDELQLPEEYTLKGEQGLIYFLPAPLPLALGFTVLAFLPNPNPFASALRCCA